MTARTKTGTGRRIALIIIAAVAIAGLGYFIHEYFQVRSVVAAGNARFTSAYVEAIADVGEGTHMLSLDMEQIRENIQQAEPYLQVVSIRRQLPETLVIEVAERRPAAYLPYGAAWLLIDINTDILEIMDENTVPECPVVEGIAVDNPQIGALLETQDAFKISVMQEILQNLDQRELFTMIAVVDLSNINNITMLSRDGLEIRLGQAERIADKIKWVQNRLPALVREGQSDGLLDVSSGSFATYTMYEGPQALPSSGPEGSAEPSAEGYGGSGEETGTPPDPGQGGEEGSSTPSPGALWTVYGSGSPEPSASSEPS